jgi:hypothetical protein
MGKSQLVQQAIRLQHIAGNPCASLPRSLRCSASLDNLRKSRIKPDLEHTPVERFLQTMAHMKVSGQQHHA